jgi:hypothetical protein
VVLLVADYLQAEGGEQAAWMLAGMSAKGVAGQWQYAQ